MIHSKKILVFGLFFTFIVCIAAPGEVINFPFFNKVYSFNEADLTLSGKSTGYYFSKDYFKIDDGLFLVDKASTPQKILCLKGEKEYIVHQDYFSQAIITSGANPYCLTISTDFIGTKGFTATFYKVTKEDNKLSLQKSGTAYIDLFVSDFEIEGDTIVLSGTDSSNRFNYIYRADCKRGILTQIFKQEKKSNFLKILSVSGYTGVYSSGIPGSTSQNKVYLFPGNNQKPVIIELPLEKRVLYGKGFTSGNKLYIPAIDREYNIRLYVVDPHRPDTKAWIIDIPTGVYKVILSGKKRVYFVGFNYYKEKNAFYFLGINVDTGKVFFLKPLR